MHLEDRILFIDGDAIVIDKPAGLPVDPPRDGSLSLENHLESLKFGFQRWPMPVHRLDRDTSGCLLLSRNPKAHARLQQAFEQGLVAVIARTLDIRVAYDWSGGLIWLEAPATTDAGTVEIRRAIAEYGGHATLIRAERGTRASVDVFQPLEASLAALTTRLKAAFDPAGILNPGRMYPGV